MRKSEYIKYLQKRNSKLNVRKRLYYYGVMVILIINLILLLLVKYDVLFTLPNEIKEYLLEARVFQFSEKDFLVLLQQYNLSNLFYKYLSYYYWYINISTIIAFLIVLFRPRKYSKSKTKEPQFFLLKISKLNSALKTYIAEPNRKNRFFVKRNLQSDNIYYSLSPIRKQWFKHETMQWFKSDDINKDKYRVINSIHFFERSFLDAVNKRYPLDEFVLLLDILENYFFLNSKRTEKEIYPNFKIESDTGYLILSDFSIKARKLIIKVNRFKSEQHISLSSKLFDKTSQIVKSPAVKYAFTISGIAGVVMLMGSFIFGIEPSQAFNTWFVVTFGSLTVSVGVSTFKFNQIEELK